MEHKLCSFLIIFLLFLENRKEIGDKADGEAIVKERGKYREVAKFETRPFYSRTSI